MRNVGVGAVGRRDRTPGRLGESKAPDKQLQSMNSFLFRPLWTRGRKLLLDLIMFRPVIIDTSPPIHRNMGDTLNRDAFRKSITILAARVAVSKTNIVVRSPIMKQSVSVLIVYSDHLIPFLLSVRY